MSSRTAPGLADRLDQATRAKRLLQHPFYKAWAAGTLTRDDLAEYSAQYWRQVEAFPGYLSALAGRLEGRAEDIVRANLADEVDDDHASLWLAFARSVGADASDVRASKPEPETRACVNAFATACEEASPAFALGMLYGYESQTPEVATTKVDGLRRHYGIDGAGLDYFKLHGELDVEHAAELAAAIQDVAVDPVSVDQAVAGATAGAEAIWGLLDGVVRTREIACSA